MNQRLTPASIKVLQLLADKEPLLWGKRTGRWFTFATGDIDPRYVDVLEARRLIWRVKDQAFVTEYGITEIGRTVLANHPLTRKQEARRHEPT